MNKLITQKRTTEYRLWRMEIITLPLVVVFEVFHSFYILIHLLIDLLLPEKVQEAIGASVMKAFKFVVYAVVLALGVEGMRWVGVRFELFERILGVLGV